METNRIESNGKWKERKRIGIWKTQKQRNEMKLETMAIEVEFVEPVLGSTPSSREVAAEYIAAKAPTAEAAKEEVEAIPAEEELEKLTTIFPSDEKGLFVWNYHWKGYLKENLHTLAELGDAKTISIYTAARAVDKFLFVEPRRIYILGPDGNPIKKPDGYCERSLRAKTMRGDRICLARSEQVNAGSRMRLAICWMEPEDRSKTKTKTAVIDKELISKCLNLGARSGWGQWRSSSAGLFKWREIS